MNPGRQMNLGVYAVGTGNHVSGWRVPGAATSSEDFSIFKTIADSCERGKLDFLFVGDSLAFVADRHPGQMLRFEPLTLHAALATQTSRVGLVATASTTYSAPFNVARVFASLDKLSGGRAGWNVVTTGMPEAAGNFGSAGPVDHATRYEAATEFVEVVQGLWDSWEEGAIIDQCGNGRIFRQDKSAFARPRRQILFGAWAAQSDTHAARPTGACAGGSFRGRAKSLRHDSRK